MQMSVFVSFPRRASYVPSYVLVCAYVCVCHQEKKRLQVEVNMQN